MKKVLIIVLSSDFPPYDRMITTSQSTWDSIEVENVETIFVCGQSVKPSTGKIVYLSVDNDLFSMGRKNLLALGGALANKEFDFVARVNASCYVNKKELIKYVQELPSTEVFAGLRVTATPEWIWGGGNFIISKDVVQKIIDNKGYWDHSQMEDRSMSFLVAKLGIPFTDGRACSIDLFDNSDLSGNKWLCMCYGTESFTFNDFADVAIKNEGQFFYRVKQDYDRNMDAAVMNELFKYLK